MGRRDRERIKRIQDGEEAPFKHPGSPSTYDLAQARKGLGNPLTRKLAALRARGGVKKELSKGSVENQTDRLNELVGTGTLSERKLKESIMRKAPGEMDKGIKKFQKQGKEITEESLLSEVRSSAGFLKMCAKVGLDYDWFVRLARERMEAHGL